MITKKILPTKSFPPAVAGVPGIGVFRRPLFPPYELPVPAADHLIGLGYAVESGNPPEVVQPLPSPLPPSAPVVEDEPSEEQPLAEEDSLEDVVEYFSKNNEDDLVATFKKRIAQRRIELIKEADPITAETVKEHLTPGLIEIVRAEIQE